MTLVFYRKRAFENGCAWAGCSSALSIKPLEGSRSRVRRARGAMGIQSMREIAADGRKSPERSPCWIAPLVGESGASLSSHTRKQFHTADKSDSGSHRHQYVAKKSDVRNLFRRAASKNSSSDLLIAASPIIEGAERSGGQFDLTTAFEHFQITNVHPTDGYGLRATCQLRFSRSTDCRNQRLPSELGQ